MDKYNIRDVIILIYSFIKYGNMIFILFIYIFSPW